MSGVQSRGSSKRRIFRKVRRYLLHYILLAAFCLAIAFIMCYTVFFKLDKIKISRCTVYSETQIVDEIGAEKGESLFKINISNAEKKLVGKLPYIRSVKISRQFPTTLKVEIEEEEVLGAVYTDEGFAILSTTGKVLETGVLALSEGIPQIVGITGQTYSTGSYVRESSNLNSDLIPQIQALQTVQQELKNNDFNDITYYDVTDMLNIKVMIEDRLLMKLGTNIDMDYKIHFIKGVLEVHRKGKNPRNKPVRSKRRNKLVKRPSRKSRVNRSQQSKQTHSLNKRKTPEKLRRMNNRQLHRHKLRRIFQKLPHRLTRLMELSTTLEAKRPVHSLPLHSRQLVARRSRQGMDRLRIRRSPKINRAARKLAEMYSTRQAVLRL